MGQPIDLRLFAAEHATPMDLPLRGTRGATYAFLSVFKWEARTFSEYGKSTPAFAPHFPHVAGAQGLGRPPPLLPRRV